MGIKGIYKEIGPGDRVSLCKLAIDTLEQTGRPLRLAVDFSIWQFQVQAAKGGANPAIRTLFYRLVRLLGLAIHPIFVFDGPNKPAFKRNKRSSGRGDVVATAMAKRMIRLFGFAMHDAPGEAEAECALLEQQGVVDAVLSEDVDTIMFGCRRTLRNWTAEGTKGSKSPTHVSVYDAGAVAAGPCRLDREGMVLVALMSGGDYLPEGVPGCGVKVACEAARAGFGRDLCRIKRADRDGLVEWKERLLHELRTNEGGFFRTKHRALAIPESFPNMEILRYYTHPVVSREATVDRLRDAFPPASTVDVVGLREFSRETFDWAFRGGAIKLIRVLAPSLLVQQCLERYVSSERDHDDLDLKQRQESALVKAISSRRVHFSTDATPELRISFIPANIVKLDLSKEPEEEVEEFGRSGIALNSDDEFDDEAAEELGNEQPKSSSARKPFDPLQPDLNWVPETVLKLGVPLAVEDWEAKQREKEQRVAARATRKPRAKKTDMPVGALDKFVKVTKNVVVDNTAKDPLAPALGSSPPRASSSLCNPPAPRGRSKQPKKTPTAPPAPPASKPPADVNPWTLANSQASPRATESFPSSASQAQPKPSSVREPILISSSPVVPASPAAPSAMLRYSETTPTRTKRPSPAVENVPSPASLFSPSPSPGKQRFPVSEESAEEKRAATTMTPPARNARPFKRVKSVPDGAIKPATTQKSIKEFGRVVKKASASRIDTKGVAVSNTQPIEIPSSDDEDFPLPSLKPPPACAASIFRRKTTPPIDDSFHYASDDDPFASPPPIRRRTPPPLRCADSPASPSEGEPGQQLHQPTVDDGSDTANDDATTIPSTKASTAATTVAAKSATTKLYIPRTSLNGLGYFSEVEVDRDEADQVLAAHNGNGSELKGGKGSSRGRGRAWRLSDLQVVDLTAED
ncbi:hypothetical protein C8A00DRAFT_30768 [Chaetomidium leptoderma]|uniref:Flap structure-specific endonuclease n=1 Tax=Chaetomidium leptoderma TaxID=669021 RepID=A0AAN6VRB3_9PEZI|nr:hypothetical protein C8A00DRAFT_30768 [Chaetomidium leptoderma]